MERDIIVIVEGGGMSVGFGIGVLESLQKQHPNSASIAHSHQSKKLQ
jgi:hypothetical protein